ncbi:MAG: hypothetical protein Q8L20_03270 [Gammaproteobacteria bacterium]|nr:hypothetical protein [Gammaproteobacteria bacterium]
MKLELTNEVVVCGRFDDSIEIRGMEEKEALLRISSNNPRKEVQFEFIPVAIDEDNFYLDGNFINARDFISSLSKNQRRKLLVLTQRERHQLAELELETGAFVRSLEECFPVFTGIRYIDSVKTRYLELNRNLHKLREKGIISATLGKHFSTKNQFRVERKVRFKSTLDRNFYFANPKGYQEVFRLYEERKNRVIVALDYNSMYPSCMDGDFLEPRFLEYWHSTSREMSIEDLPQGLYKVALRNPKKGHFKEFHPFEFTLKGRSEKFRLEENQEIHCLAFKFEIEWFQDHFESIEIYEGICSKSTISHPLHKRSKGIYAEKAHFKSQGAGFMMNLCQFELQALYSATAVKRYRDVRFSNIREAAQYVSSYFGVRFSEADSPLEVILFFSESRLVKVQSMRDEIRLSLIDMCSSFNVLSMSSQIVAKARLKLLSAIVELKKWRGLEICYANVDSIHLSIEKEDLPLFLSHMEKRISDRMGDFKVHAIACRGYWFDVGRYWLFGENNELVLYKNKLFNVGGKKKPFNKFRKLKTLVRAPSFAYVKNHYAVISNSFEYGKRLKHAPQFEVDFLDFERYSFSEIQNLDVAGDTRTAEMLRSKLFKIELFQRVATV